eukprot:11071462-Alexandrium_andersonii.AAC.1
MPSEYSYARTYTAHDSKLAGPGSHRSGRSAQAARIPLRALHADLRVQEGQAMPVLPWSGQSRPAQKASRNSCVCKRVDC